MIYTTRRIRTVGRYAEAFADLLVAVLQGEDLRVAVERCGRQLDPSWSVRETVERSRQEPMVACYIDSSFPALLYFAYKYADSVERGILANANAGGENVARGSLLGALLGAAHGMDAFPAWTHELYAKNEINAEIDAFTQSIVASK